MNKEKTKVLRYQCDKCKSTFEESEIVMKDFIDNLHILGNPIMVKNRISGKPSMVYTDQIKEGDCSLHCPKCDEVHLFGFDTVSDKDM